jgi:lysine-N-methylase
VRGPRFISHFHCIADRCEDPCCHGWQVAIDEPHYRRLEQLIPPERLKATIRVTDQETPFALIVLGQDGVCPYLEDRLCLLHRDFGEEVMGNACASYPRGTSQLGDVREASLQLSCPEAARLCLLAPDAMELLELPDDAGGRDTVRQRVSRETMAGSPWLGQFESVRQKILSLLSEPRYPVGSRLFFVAYLAHLLNGGRSTEASLAALAQPGALDQLHGSFVAANPVDPLAATVVLVILSAALQSPGPRALRALVERTVALDLAAVGETASGDASRDLKTLGAARLDRLHRARQPEELDRFIANLAKHFFYDDWFLRSPTLLVHLQGFLVRLAMIRWLMLAHPGADREAAIVEVVYALARTLEHNQALSHEITAAIERAGLTTIAHAVSLLKF